MKSFKPAGRIRKHLTETIRLHQGIFAVLILLLFGITPLTAADTVAEKDHDSAITIEVKKALLFHLFLDTRTETHEGVVTLSGHAENAAEKDLNTRLAAEIIGVKRVLNRMVIPLAVAGNN